MEDERVVEQHRWRWNRTACTRDVAAMSERGIKSRGSQRLKSVAPSAGVWGSGRDASSDMHQTQRAKERDEKRDMHEGYKGARAMGSCVSFVVFGYSQNAVYALTPVHMVATPKV